MQILLANPRGLCAGVNRAITILNRVLFLYGSPIYVHHEIVHNRYLVNDFCQRGVMFIEKISEVPDDAILIFSAHGVSQAIRQEAKLRRLKMLFDATCPLVTKVHMEVIRASQKGQEVILIGHLGHPEVKGTMGQYDNMFGGIYLVESKEDIQKLNVKDKNNLCFVTQTTLSVEDTSDIIDELKKYFPNIISPRKNDICYATTNRQEAVRKLSYQVDVVLVIGSKNSSNSNRLSELVKKIGKESFLIDSVDEIQKNWFNKVSVIGITAGASAPDILVNEVIEYLKTLGVNKILELYGHQENIVFQVPKELRIEIKEK
ncbi:4-hydroxy-3-methylbut-2-enyl diphosphate reductase [Arsenophonus symbiont of Ornithomya chloropus]|uniref:4-hydroxy-3-methylbut-2-enyl diphosphate reductase n=1 Tax=Arsenophonus symbiont of Ornithomya chloropus TaxID=634121 RepID=UPI0032B2C78D